MISFKELKDYITEIQSDTEKTVHSSIQYYKLYIFKVLTQSLSEIVKILLLGSVVFLVLLFVSIASALALGNYFQSNILGFLLVGGFFAILFVFIYVFRKKLVEKTLLSKMSDIYFKDS